MPSLPLDAIFFDFDGVLIDSVGLKREAFRQVIRAVAPARLELAMTYFMNHGGVARTTKFRHVWTEVLGRPEDEARIRVLVESFRQLVFEEACATSCIAGAAEFLQRHHRHVALYVISGTPEEELQAIIDRRGMNSYFRGVFGSPATKVEIGQRILNEQNLDAERVCFVGDATTDRDAALELGIKFVGVDGPHLRPFLLGDETMIPDLTVLEETLLSEAVALVPEVGA